MLLLDTEDSPPEERADAFRDVLRNASIPVAADPLRPSGRFRARVDVWQFGRDSLVAADLSAYRMERRPEHIRAGSAPVAAVTFKTRGRGWFSQFGQDHALGPRDVVLGDLTAPYSCFSTGASRSRSFRMPFDQLGLPVDVLRRSAGQLSSSPLYDLVGRHLRQFADRADTISGDAGATAVGTATTDLVRALITSAARDERWNRPVMEETLMTRVTAYVGQHLAERDLTAERIARTQHVSVRQLYKTCAAAGISLEQWIIHQRLEGARSTLSSAAGGHRSIAGTALAWGFTDPSHFARRFRDAFGMTPHEWQQARAVG
jgi:AraC-like DNA-binding protein